MAKKPGTNPKNEFAFFNVVYEDGSQRSNRRVPSELLGGLRGRRARARLHHRAGPRDRRKSRPPAARDQGHQPRRREEEVARAAVTFRSDCQAARKMWLRVPAACSARVMHRWCPSTSRGRRECRMQAAPMARLQQKTQAVVTTGQPNSPAFPARWFTAYTCSPRCAGLFSHRRARKSSRKRLTSASGGRDPHDFARPCRPAFVSRGPTRPSHPAPRFVTIGRNAPLDELGMGEDKS